MGINNITYKYNIKYINFTHMDKHYFRLYFLNISNKNLCLSVLNNFYNHYSCFK